MGTPPWPTGERACLPAHEVAAVTHRSCCAAWGRALPRLPRASPPRERPGPAAARAAWRAAASQGRHPRARAAADHQPRHAAPERAAVPPAVRVGLGGRRGRLGTRRGLASSAGGALVHVSRSPLAAACWPTSSMLWSTRATLDLLLHFPHSFPACPFRTAAACWPTSSMLWWTRATRTAACLARMPPWCCAACAASATAPTAARWAGGRGDQAAGGQGWAAGCLQPACVAMF